MIGALALVVATALPVTWGSVSLGFPVSSLRLNVGDPLRVVSFDGGARNVARYWIPGSSSTYYLVLEERGYIQGFDIFTDLTPSGVLPNVAPDPSGVRLGDTLAAVKAKHPNFNLTDAEIGTTQLSGRVSPTVGVIYTFAENRVRSMHWSTKLDASLPKQPPLTTPKGNSFATAISDVQRNENDGVAWEYQYLAFHPCADGDNGRWKLQNQALLHDKGRSYDVLHATCPATKAQREFYFDITSYFGKM